VMSFRRSSWKLVAIACTPRTSGYREQNTDRDRVNGPA
jgi:hypothetical protein